MIYSQAMGASHPIYTATSWRVRGPWETGKIPSDGRWAKTRKLSSKQRTDTCRDASCMRSTGMAYHHLISQERRSVGMTIEIVRFAVLGTAMAESTVKLSASVGLHVGRLGAARLRGGEGEAARTVNAGTMR